LKLKIVLGTLLIVLAPVLGSSQSEPVPNYEVVPLDRRDVVVVRVNGVTPLIGKSPDVPNAVLIKCVDKD